MLNRVILIGRLTRDPELRYTTSGVAVVNFSLAVDRPYLNQQGQRDADFIRIKVWRKLAETVANNLGKGWLLSMVAWRFAPMMPRTELNGRYQK